MSFILSYQSLALAVKAHETSLAREAVPFLASVRTWLVNPVTPACLSLQVAFRTLNNDVRLDFLVLKLALLVYSYPAVQEM